MDRIFGKHLRAWSGVTLVASILSGCAGVDFYSDPQLQQKTGIPIYGSKPYVMVVRTKSKEKPVEVSIQYITDRSQVIYANPRSGFGSADLKIGLANGQLTQFGQITDTKIPELITAVSGLVTARGAAAKAFAEADEIKGKVGAGTTQAAKIPDAVTLKAINDLLNDMSSDKAKSDIAGLDKSEIAIVDNVIQALANIVDAIKNPAKASLVSKYGDELIAAAKDFASLPLDPNASSKRATALQRIRDWKPRLADIVNKITPEEISTAEDFELYEIMQTKGDVTLRRVK